MKLNHSWLRVSFLAAVFASLVSAQAATNGFVVPTFRGTVNSQSGYWETFTNAIGAPGNLPDQPGATTSAILTQNNPGAIVTGGNIYDPATNSAFVITDAPPFLPATVVLQTRTLGNPLDYTSVALSYSDSNGLHSVAPLFRYELSRAGGGISSLWQWDLTGLSVTNYAIAFNGSGPHVSLDAVTLDTAAQFAPAFVGQPFSFRSAIATLARWNYLASDFGLATRPTASVFGAVTNAPNFDARDAQYLLGWSTTNKVPAGMGVKNYLVRRARVTLTIATAGYTYTGQLRDYRSYFPKTDPRYVTPVTANFPVELFGVGFRGGFYDAGNNFVPWASTNYPQDGPWAGDPSFDPFGPDNNYYTNRAAYAAGFNTNGVLVDVSDNVGDNITAEIPNPFEVAPFAVGQSADVAEGQPAPIGTQLTFELNLNDPLIYGYLQKSLNEGNLSLMAACLVTASQSGPATFPSFYTIFSAAADDDEFPLLDIEGEVVRTNVDYDNDGLPDDWQNFYFGTVSSGATASFTGDGVSNYAKYVAGTNPTNSAANLRVQPPAHGQLRFNAAPSRQYAIQLSTNLPAWQTVTNPALIYSSPWLDKSASNVTYPAPVYTAWQDTNAVTSQRFYRINVQ